MRLQLGNAQPTRKPCLDKKSLRAADSQGGLWPGGAESDASGGLHTRCSVRETWTLQDLGRSKVVLLASPQGDLEKWEHRGGLVC